MSLNIMESYQIRGREILAEIICEYIEDADYDARRIYEEILSVLASEVQGREEASKKAIEVRELAMGKKFPAGMPGDYVI